MMLKPGEKEFGDIIAELIRVSRELSPNSYTNQHVIRLELCAIAKQMLELGVIESKQILNEVETYE